MSFVIIGTRRISQYSRVAAVAAHYSAAQLSTMMSLMMQQLCVSTTSHACGSTITEHVQSPRSRDFTTPHHATPRCCCCCCCCCCCELKITSKTSCRSAVARCARDNSFLSTKRKVSARRAGVPRGCARASQRRAEPRGATKDLSKSRPSRDRRPR